MRLLYFVKLLVVLVYCCSLSLRALSLKGSYVFKLVSLLANTLNFFDACTEFSLAGYSSTAVYANNSDIDINLVGEGFEGLPQITDGGALECHTDDTTCCRGIDNPNGTGRGEWYYPDGTIVPPPGGDIRFYRTRDQMVIRLNRISASNGTLLTGVYRCEVPGAGGVNIIRYVSLSRAGKLT